MKYQTTCAECGHKLTAYTMPLNSSLIKAFIKFAERFFATHKVGLKKGQIGLTNAQYSNFQNLRHFGIVKQDEKGNLWYLTPLGESFYFAESLVQTPAGHMGGRTLAENHPAWETHDKPRKFISIRDILPDHYKQRPEFQAEKSGQERLF